MALFDFSYRFPNTIEEIDGFSGKDFEVFLFEFFKVLNYSPRLTDETNDKGIDLTIRIDDHSGVRKIGIQAKRWKAPVGADEIRSMLDGKNHYNLDEVWIITTSKLTASAITTAKNNNIQILNRNNVIDFLSELKKLPDIKFMEPSKPYFQSKKESEKITNQDPKIEYEDVLESELAKKLKQLRIELSKKLKLTPIYIVYNNNTIIDICEKLPKTIEELTQIKGFGTQKATQFGAEVLDVVKNYLLEETPKELIEKIMQLRTRIAQFNKLSSDFSAFPDTVVYQLAKKKPMTVEDLKGIHGFPPENIDLFGEYLITKMKSL